MTIQELQDLYDEADAWPWSISDVCELCDLDPISPNAALISAAVVVLPSLLRLWKAAEEEHHSFLMEHDCPTCCALIRLRQISVDHTPTAAYLSETEMKELPHRLREAALDSCVPVGGELMHILRVAADALDIYQGGSR